MAASIRRRSRRSGWKSAFLVRRQRRKLDQLRFVGAEMSVQPLLVEDHALEVAPDAPVVGAAVLTAWFWPVFICTAEAGCAILVGTPAILFPPEDAWAAEIPAQLTSFDLFRRQPDGQLAAD